MANSRLLQVVAKAPPFSKRRGVSNHYE